MEDDLNRWKSEFKILNLSEPKQASKLEPELGTAQTQLLF